MKRVLPLALLSVLGLALLLAVPAFGQQSYVTRYDAYVGYSFLDSPHVSLFENGVAGQFGVRVKKWLSLGFDYNLVSGDLTLVTRLLTNTLQQEVLATQPPGYTLVLPAHSRTQTFAFGPQVSYRHFTHFTLFVRPLFLGGIHEVATPKPTDPFAMALVQMLAPSGKKTDTVVFVGFGGGVDLIATRHVSLRTQADLVYDHLFSDVLKDGRFTVRFSIGPAFNFGRNIVAK